MSRGRISVRFWVLVVLLFAGCQAEELPTSRRQAATQSEEVSPADRGYMGITFEAIDTEPLVISGVVPGSGAELAGVKSGDLLVQIEETPRPSMRQIQELLFDRLAGESLTIVVQRGTDEVQLSFPLMSATEVEAGMTADQ